MKIEKLNDNQMRFTLTAEDLNEREMKIGELVYGSEKARRLIQDMVEMAKDEYDFDVSEEPFFIEVVPINYSNVIITMKKMDNTEDTDTYFPECPHCAAKETNKAEETQIDIKDSGACMMTFASLSDAIEFARIIVSVYNGTNTLYKLDGADPYQLIMIVLNTEEFGKIQTIMADYGELKPVTPARVAYLEEHVKPLIKDKALQTLATM